VITASGDHDAVLLDIKGRRPTRTFTREGPVTSVAAADGDVPTVVVAISSAT
jgi:hypothetical protein